MERTDSTCDQTSALTIFLAGVGAGVALTVLFAPVSGAATRRLIGRKVQEGEKWMKEKAAVAEDYVVSQKADLTERMEDVAEVLGRPSRV